MEQLTYRQCRSILGGIIGASLMSGMEADVRAALRYMHQALSGDQPVEPPIKPDKGIMTAVSGTLGALIESSRHDDVMAAAAWWLEHWDESMEAMRQRVTDNAAVFAEKLFGDTAVPQSVTDAIVEKVKTDVGSTRKH